MSRVIPFLLTVFGCFGCTARESDHLADCLKQCRDLRGTLRAEVHAKLQRETGIWQIAGLNCIFADRVTDADLAPIKSLSSLNTLRVGSDSVAPDCYRELTRNGLRTLASLHLRRLILEWNPTEDYVEAIGTLPELETLGLGIDGPSTHEGHGDCGNLRTLKRLRRLKLTNMGLNDASLDYIILLKGIEELLLTRNSRITDVGVVKLKGLDSLRVLELDRIGSIGILTLKDLPSLERLAIDQYQPSAGQADLSVLRNLTWLSIGDVAHEQPVQIRLPSELRRLDVSYSGVAMLDLQSARHIKSVRVLLPGDPSSEDGPAWERANDLSWLKAIPELTELTLEHPTERNLKEIASFKSLCVLDLHCGCLTPIGNEGMWTLAALQNLDSLKIEDRYSGGNKRLEVNEGLAVLSKLTNLRCLELRGLPAVSVKALANIRELKHLRSLALDLCGAGVDGCLDSLLAHIRELTEMEELSLSFVPRVRLTDEGLKSLACLRKLRYLDLRRSYGYSDDALASLMRALPNLKSLDLTRCGPMR